MSHQIMSRLKRLAFGITGAAVLIALSAPSAYAQSTGHEDDPLRNTILTPHPINPAANTTNPSALAVQGQNPFLGSTQQCRLPGKTIALSLSDAIACGLRFNLGLIDTQQGSAEARAARMHALSILLPQISANATEQYKRYSGIPVGAEKIHFGIPAVGETIYFPLDIGPFNYQYSGLDLTQNLIDERARHAFHSAAEENKASIAAAADSRDIVVLAVGSAYLQVVASKARLLAVRAELDAAITLDDFIAERVREKASPEIDTIRAQVARHTAEQRLTDAETGVGKDKLTLARVLGLPLNQDFDITDDLPYRAIAPPTPAAAVAEALEFRSDLKSAAHRLRAAEENVRAQSAQRLPTLIVAADYGAVGTNPGNIQQTYSVGATLSVPLFTGRRIESDIASARANLTQRRAEYEDLKGRVEYDIRTALFDLEAADKSVQVADLNRSLALRGLSDTRDRFRVGVSTSLEMVQAEQSVADADDNYINSLFGHDLAKLELARALGVTATDLSPYLKGN